MTLAIAGTPEELRTAVSSLAQQIPALAPLKDAQIQAGHVDVTLNLPKLGDLTARLTVDVNEHG